MSPAKKWLLVGFLLQHGQTITKQNTTVHQVKIKFIAMMQVA